MGFVATEERTRRELEAHAWTSWWVYRSIELADGAKHDSWDDWAEMRGVRWRRKTKSRAEIVAEINAKFDKAFSGVKFRPAK